MKTFARLLVPAACLLLSGLVPVARAQFTWTGVIDSDAANPGNWQGAVAPTGSGSEDFVFHDASNPSITFANNFAFHNVTINVPSTGYRAGASGITLVLTGNVTTTGGTGGFFVFQGDKLTLGSGSHVFNTQASVLYVFGDLDGSGDLVKTGSSAMVVHSGDNSSTYAGNIDLQAGSLLVDGSHVLGSGTLTMNGGTLAVSLYDPDSHVRLDNNLIFSSTVIFGQDGQVLSLLDITGNVQIESGATNVNLFADSLNQTVIEGNITETDAGSKLTKTGQGTIYLLGANNYSGGIDATSGVLILGQQPNVGGSLFVSTNGYLGTEDPANLQPHFLDHFLRSSTGIIGFDSPDASMPQAFNENIDLTFFDPALRIGTATSVAFHGSITPQGQTYQFGGRGILYVFDDLDDNGSARNVTVSDGLQMYMENTDGFSGVLRAKIGGAAIFDAFYSPSGSALAEAGGYIGFTQNTTDSVNSFIFRFDQANTHGVVGFDSMGTTPTDPIPPRLVTENIDLTGFNSDVFIGTSTTPQSDGTSSVVLSDVITPQGATYQFTGFRNGQLTVDSLLEDVNISTPRSVVIGLPSNLVTISTAPGIIYSTGVVLDHANTYTGGTLLQSGQLIVGSSAALGTGTLTVGQFNPIAAGLSADGDGIVLPNAIVFDSSNSDLFTLHGAHDFELAGNLSGGDSFFQLFKFDTNAITLSGNNAGLLSGFRVIGGSIIFASDTAAGTGPIDVNNNSEVGGTITFTSAAPHMGSLHGEDQGKVQIYTSGSLTINQTADNNYDGQITGSGGLTFAGPRQLTLNNPNSDYTGVTNVRGGTLLFTAAMTNLTGDFIMSPQSGDSGTLKIGSGGSIDANTATVGAVAGSSGGLWVTDPGSSFSSVGTLRVGANSGTGFLTILNGGSVSTDIAEVGFNTQTTYGGEVQLDGSGSIWNVTTSLSLGNLVGKAVMFLTGGAVLNVGSGTGIVEVAGNAGSTGDLIVGNAGLAGFVRAAAIHGGAGSAYVEFTTTNTIASPYYLTQDGTSGGTPVQLTGSVRVIQHQGTNVLLGNSTYSGGTLLAGGTLVAGSSNALGSGTVSFQGGNLSVASGVTITNTLTFSSGAVLGGNGTIGSHVNAGTGVIISPGNSPGTLTFSSGLTWAPGGEYDWQLQTNAGGAGTSTGWDLINVTGGPLDMASLTSSSFTLKLSSLDGSGNPGSVGDFSGGPMSWTIATASSGITGFNATNIAIDASDFVNQPSNSNFTLSVSGGTDLVLNFTPVPEPSTCGLIALGLVGLACVGRRRRRSRV